MNPLRCLFAVVSLMVVSVVGRASPLVFTATLSGAEEVPANSSPATGSATVIFDSAAHTMRVMAAFSGLLGTTTASHIHAPIDPVTGTASVATQTPSFVGFPLGVTTGTFDNTYDLTLASSYRAGFITSSGGTVALAEAALGSALVQGKAYFNIHTTRFPGGEIRGTLTAVPDHSSAALLLLPTLAGLLAFASRQRALRS